MGNKDNSLKRKARDNDLATCTTKSEVSSLESEDGAHAIDDLNEPTMGEKFVDIHSTKNGKDFDHEIVDTSLAKPPSADSVYILLKQAIRADDRSLLIDCLFRQDEKVVTNSLSLLTPSEVLKFLQSLISIIQLRGAVLACALPWLRSLLLQHASSIMSQEASVAALNSLYQRIESRASTFNPTLQLSSFLNVLYDETVDEGDEENDAVPPVIYEDNDESDDDGSEDAMKVESVEDPQTYSDVSDVDENCEISE